MTGVSRSEEIVCASLVPHVRRQPCAESHMLVFGRDGRDGRDKSKHAGLFQKRDKSEAYYVPMSNQYVRDSWDTLRGSRDSSLCGTALHSSLACGRGAI